MAEGGKLKKAVDKPPKKGIILFVKFQRILAISWRGAISRTSANFVIHKGIAKMKENTEMTIQELYELLSKRLDDMDIRHTERLNDMDVRHTERLNDMEARITKQLDDLDARHTQRLDEIDERHRGVETGISEPQGRKAGFSVLKDWIVASCAVAALIVSIIALTN